MGRVRARSAAAVREAPPAPVDVDVLESFHGPVRSWFKSSFGEPTLAQKRGWPPILAGESTLLLAPTGSGKTLAAFLVAIDRLMFDRPPAPLAREPASAPAPKAKRGRGRLAAPIARRTAASADGCRVLYISPLKALAVDVERNLRAPLAGIAATAEREGVPFRMPTVGIRSGDTAQSERARMLRHPPDILITTPESLYLMLTSSAREVLSTVETIIVDEIHSMVASKRGAHLFLTLERLAMARAKDLGPTQRIGLSATQRPLGEVARLLGGGDVEPDESGPWRARPVTTVDAGSKKAWNLRVEVPVEDMTKLGEPMEEIPSGPAAQGPQRRSIWPSIHPRLIELIKSHRSTMIFANSRRLAERLAAALNELAEEELVLAHHGSVARERRAEIEDRLKRGTLPAIVATSTMELGIDMGAVDLVIQIEAPPSVASGIQRIGRAGHHVGATSSGVIFPKYRGDLLAAAAATARMQEGVVEETLYPRNPLDVLAQQVVAIAGMDAIDVEALYALLRRAAPFAELPRASFEGVLDMLSGRYPSDEFAELKPRLTWDRVSGNVRARDGAKTLAVVSGGTIPDRGLYGVYLAGVGDTKTGKGSRRVGELDEEMVFESRTGDIFLLGASSWRIEEITHDRVLVTPAPGQPGKMPFWHGDRAGRPIEFGQAIGKLSRELVAAPRDKALARLHDDHGLDDKAAQNLLAYLQEQAEATGEVPSDRTIVVERTVDELGSYRVCILTPFGARVHAPWANAVLAQWRAGMPGGGQPGRDLEVIWSDDGIAFRLPEVAEMPSVDMFLPPADEVEELVVGGLGQTSLFASRFRENAARALLLPRKFPGHRSPLWAQRKKSADLLAVAARYGSFPILLETYRECLRDVFDLPALIDLLRRIGSRQVRVLTVDSQKPSPFASSLLFSWVASFIYDGDAPLAERRAQALTVDTAELRELLGEAELRELLDADALLELERTLQRFDGKRPLRSPDNLHDLLIGLGDQTPDELRLRAEQPAAVDGWIEALVKERRVLDVTIGGERRIAAAEDAARLRDALGVVPPRGLPQALLEPVADPLGDLCSRYARTHGPFQATALAARLGLGIAPVRATLERLAERGKVLEGDFTPGGRAREWCDAEVLRSLKRKSLAKLRQEVEPVEQPALGRLLLEWQGVRRPRQGLDALLTVVEQLQGAPIPASVLETDVLPSRILGYRPADLDRLCAAGEVVWTGVEPLGPSDGRIALYLTDQLPHLAPGAAAAATGDAGAGGGDAKSSEPSGSRAELAARVRALLRERGALFFADLTAETGAFAPDLSAALWDLVWAGEVTNDTFAPLRSYLQGGGEKKRGSATLADATRGLQTVRARGVRPAFRSRRVAPPGSEGRWSLVTRGRVKAPSETERRTALARVLLERYGVLTREAVGAENVAGGFGAVYDVLKAMEESGRVRRGYFVAGLGATQFALPGCDDRLRGVRDVPEEPFATVLAATDPANPYGAALPWISGTVIEPGEGEPPNLPVAAPVTPKPTGPRPQRAAGAHVVLVDGALAAWINRAGRAMTTFLPPNDPERSRVAAALGRALLQLVDSGRRRALLLSEIDGEPAEKSALGVHLGAAGFSLTSRGWFRRTAGGRG